MNFLFWNLQRKGLDGLVVRLAEEHLVDVLVLIEHKGMGGDFLRLLRGVGNYQRASSSKRFAVYVRFDRRQIQRIRLPVANRRLDVWQLRTDGEADVNLVAVHGLDVRNYRRSKRRLFFERVSENILWAESKAGHKRTVLLGDLNANPFAPEIVGATGLHAIRMKHINGRKERRVLGKPYEFFYNPMWQCYRNDGGAPPGSYYFSNYGEYELFWHMIDQVVVRPDLLPFFPEDQLRILNSAGPISLVTADGIPDQVSASDHLPIFFRLNL